MKHDEGTRKRNFWLTWQGLCVLGLGAAMLFFLLTEHTAHTLYALPWAIFLLCPIMHLFMHKGHGGHAGHGGQEPVDSGMPSTEPKAREHGGHGGHH